MSAPLPSSGLPGSAEPRSADGGPSLEGASVDGIRRQLGSVRGPAFWDRLEQLSGEPAFEEFLQREFPSQAERFGPALERREFLRLMGASLGVMGLAACTRQPDELILPFARAPEYQIPGRPLYFATALSLGGAAQGLLLESHMGRPTKVEGNPDHPANLGSTDALAQAALLSLYDPDRSHSCLRAGQIDTWSAFTTELSARLEGIAAHQGEGLALLHAGENSPALSSQLDRLQAQFPRMRSYRWTSLHRDLEREGAELVFGRDVQARYHLEKARVIVALESDFLAAGPGCVRYARDFTRGRLGRAGRAEMNRLYAVEATTSLTGAMADERLALPPSALEGFVRRLARVLGLDVEAAEPEPGREETFLRALAADLTRNRGASVVVAGPFADAAVHALVHLINARLESVGATVEYTLPLESTPEPAGASMRQLAQDLRAHRVDTLVILGGNPVYDAPAELDFASLLDSVPFRVHLSSHVDETSSRCTWHVPEAHVFESWGDARSFDGTVTLVQPLIAPLFGGKSAPELVALLAGDAGASGHELLRSHWSTASGKQGEAFERFWREALHDGFVAGSAFPPLKVAPRPGLDLGPPPPPAPGLELALRPDAAVLDGRFANNAWLQETPRPITRLVWGNAALLAPETARELGLADEDVVELRLPAVESDGPDARPALLEAPVHIVPGHAARTLTLHLGYGRTVAGRLGTGIGFDAHPLRRSSRPWRLEGVGLRPTGKRERLVSVQKQPDQQGRPLARVGIFDRFTQSPLGAFEHGHGAGEEALRPPSLFPDFPDSQREYAWGMVIDLNACLGCNACMVACQSENNIPVVGADEVAKGREMHWIRVDRYFEPPTQAEGAPSELNLVHQPVPCMHCENAPCEVVCPVGATVHSSEGLNEMVYNRCVGTRYCSNNCPYKVRRFNFFHYADYETESLKLGRNPDVTVRSRGVMEKCTYCVQRINQARLDAKKEDRRIQDGEIRTACQAVCPTRAIAFGNIDDENSAVSRLRREPHHYGLLAELGTRPRTTYLGRLRNPNPELS